MVIGVPNVGKSTLINAMRNTVLKKGMHLYIIWFYSRIPPPSTELQIFSAMLIFL